MKKYLTGNRCIEMQITYRYDKHNEIYTDWYWKSTDYRWPVTTKTTGGVDRVLICCEINRRFNWNGISEDFFEKLEDTMKLNEKYNSNLYKQFPDINAYTKSIIFELQWANKVKEGWHWVEYFQRIWRYTLFEGIKDT